MKKSGFLIVTALVILILAIVPASALEPNDPYYLDGSQWYLNNPISGVNAPAAWDITTGSDIIVAVIDSGIDLNNPDLINNIWTNEKEISNNGIDDDNNGYVDDIHGWDTGFNTNDINDNLKHGTIVSSIIGAEGNNSIGTTGVCWNVKIMPIKIVSNPSYGISQTEAIIKAIYYAVNNGARIINFSTSSAPGYVPKLECQYKQALKYAEDHDVLIVFAAGNASNNNDKNPIYSLYSDGELKNTIVVASTDKNNKFCSSFSNYGKTTVDLAAPGKDIVANTVTVDKTSNFVHPRISGSIGIPELWPNIGPKGKGTSAFGSTVPITLPEEEGVCYISIKGDYNIPNDLKSGITFILTTKPLSEYTSVNEIKKDLIDKNGVMIVGDTIKGEWKIEEYSSEIGGNKFTFFPPISYDAIEKNLNTRTFYPGIIYSSSSDDSFFKFFGAYIDYNFHITEEKYSYPADTYGTSFSAPLVSGTAALILSVNPDLSASQVKDCILSTVDIVPELEDKVATGGKLNIGAAVQKAITLEGKKKAKSPAPILGIMAGITPVLLFLRRQKK